MGGSGLRNEWEVQRRGGGETKWAAPGRGMGHWEVLPEGRGVSVVDSRAARRAWETRGLKRVQY